MLLHGSDTVVYGLFCRYEPRERRNEEKLKLAVVEDSDE